LPKQSLSQAEEKVTTKPKPARSDQKHDLTPEMVLIPAGRFLLGSLRGAAHAHQNELPQHEGTLPHYCIGRYPVTNEEFARYVQAKGTTPPTHWAGTEPPAKILDHPVTNVSLLEAQAYAEWLSAETKHTYRLPTEQEWEKAARGGWPDNRVYVWGDEWQENGCNTKEAGVGGTTAVTHYATTNISPYGIVDMLGNVWEWTISAYEGYPGSTFEPTAKGKYVVRGGCWDYEQKYAHVSCRGGYYPGERRPYIGFRLAANSIEEIGE
jgi:formylglycine-generating enzyme required for sulfatase activity